MLDIKIYGCHSRDENINKCKSTLSLSDLDIVYDDRSEGGNAYYTFRKALLQPVKAGVTHRLVLPDDMQLCEGFEDKLNFLVNKFPKKVIELFPYGYEAFKLLPIETPYHRTVVLSACGIVFPVQIINEMIDWIDNKYTFYKNLTINTLIDDEAVQAWCTDYSVDMITTLPAIVQHIGDDSLLGDFPVRRTKFFIDDLTEDQKSNIKWDSNDIKEYHITPILIPGNKNSDHVPDYILSEYTVTILNPRYSSLGKTK